MKNKKGFTLIELLVVITIMGIITVLALPGVEQLQARNRNKKFESYASTMQKAGKLYVDAYSIDMFGISGNGCYDITFQDLYAKSLIKDYTAEGISCDDDKTFVHVERKDGKYSYNVSLYCEKNGKAVYNNVVTKCGDTGMTALPTITISYLSIGGFGDWSRSKDITIKITARDGLNANASIKYGWVSESGVVPSNLKQYNFQNAFGETELTFNTNISDLDGEYYLFVDGDGLVDTGGHFAQDVWSTEKLKFDKTAPETPVLTNSQNGKWSGASYVNANQYIIAVASSDNASGIRYYQYRYPNSENVWHTYANSASNNFTTPAFTKERNEIVEIRACDYADNCSTPVQNTIMIDKTSPSTPVLTNSQNGKWAGASYVNANKYRIAVASSDNASGISYYQYRYPNSENVWHTYANSASNNFTTTAFTQERNEIVEIRACDYADNCSPSAQNTIMIDKTAPTCSITKSGAGGPTTYTSVVTLTLNVSNPGIAKKSSVSYGLVNYNTATYNSISSKTQGATNGVTWYGFVKDAAGNTNTCNTGNFKVVLRKIPDFTYTGNYEIVDDNDNIIANPSTWTGNWKIRFLTSGQLTFQSIHGAANGIDVFLVGGGGGATMAGAGYNLAGGGGGYTRTVRRITATSTYITIGQGGAGGGAQSASSGTASSAFGYQAAGGKGAGGGGYNIGGAKAGNGGSGGGGGTATGIGVSGGYGGSNGSNGFSGGGASASDKRTVGFGQISVPGPNGETGNTREFGEEGKRLYAAGGGGSPGGGRWGTSGAGGQAPNTGGGGNAQYPTGQSGFSGIVIIRNAR